MHLRILIGTSNKDKRKDFEDFFTRLNVKISFPDEEGSFDFEETGKTFEENARLKSLYFSSKTDLPVLSDDSGLCIRSLDGRPGIYSARWAGNAKLFSLAHTKVYREMTMSLKMDHRCYFYCALAFSYKNSFHVFSGALNGFIQYPPRDGWGYNPIFSVDQTDTDDNSSKDLPKNFHRIRALKKFVASPFFRDL